MILQIEVGSIEEAESILAKLQQDAMPNVASPKKRKGNPGPTGQVDQHSVPDEVRAALRGLQKDGVGDVPRQLALLQKYGANRVTELKPENYAAFIADCKAV